MSFATLKKDQLKAVAEGFGLDVDEKATGPQLKAAIAEADYIDWDGSVAILKEAGLWGDEDEKASAVAKAEVKAAYEARPKDTLLKMLRANKSYQILGYTFTESHPYGLVTAEDAEKITDRDEGFRYATPKEAIEFYG